MTDNATIFKVKGSDPERFCIVYQDSNSANTKSYLMSTKFATEQELRDMLRSNKSEAEIDYIIQEARANQH